MVQLIITLLITAIVIIAIVYVLSIWIYKHAPSNMCFIRTGFLGTKVCLGQGAVVLPVFHEVTWVSLETIKLIVSRSQNQAILTSDKIRVDVVAELYTHVGHDPDSVLTASRSLGEKTFEPEQVRNLLEAKIVSGLRSHAATKTLSELHENREALAKALKAGVVESFKANGLVLEEVTIVTLEQTGKEHFNSDNVFDAEGLKIITEVTSAARRQVHETQKRTDVAIKQKELDTQLELLGIEQNEAFARAQQDKEISNEQALRVGEKQTYVLDQRMTVEQKEIENEKQLESMRTLRDMAIIEEKRKRETSEIQKELAVEQERRDREIAIIAKSREEELARIEQKLELEKAERDREIELLTKSKEQELTEISRSLAREKAEKEKEIELIGKERDRQKADIERETVISAEEELARNERTKATQETDLAIRSRALESKLSVLEIEKKDALATATQQQEVSNEEARILSEKQKYLLESRWEVEQEEIAKALALEKTQIEKEVAIIEETGRRDVADIRRTLTREQEEQDREISLLGKEETLKKRKVQQTLAVGIEERDREIALISKELEVERTDIQRFLAREREERDREIALAAKSRELEEAEIKRLEMTSERERVEHGVESVRIVADAERQKELDYILAQANAESRRVDEENKATINRMHQISQAEARKITANEEADATLIHARAASEAKQAEAIGIEKEAGAQGRAEAEVSRRKLEAEASGIEAKAGALKKYNEAATFLELARLHIEADRDVQIDQAKAMGNALQGAQIRMYGGENGTVDTIRGLFTSGFGIGEALEGVAQSLPEGLRERFAQNGIRGIFGRPGGTAGEFQSAVREITRLLEQVLPSPEDENMSFADAVSKLEQLAGDDGASKQAIAFLKAASVDGVFDNVPFQQVWGLVLAASKSIADAH